MRCPRSGAGLNLDTLPHTKVMHGGAGVQGGGCDVVAGWDGGWGQKSVTVTIVTVFSECFQWLFWGFLKLMRLASLEPGIARVHKNQ